MPDFHKIALIFSVLWIVTATNLTLAKAQETTFSEGEQLGLAACLVKCPDSDKACDNRCISQSQTKGRVWIDDVRACIRGCRNGYQRSQASARMATDEILSCVVGCRLDRIVR